MKIRKITILAFAALLAVSAAFATGHKHFFSRQYGVLSIDIPDGVYNIELKHGTCSGSSGACTLLVNDGGVTETTTPIAGADILVDGTYTHSN
jgi:hypothetical protein